MARKKKKYDLDDVDLLGRGALAAAAGAAEAAAGVDPGGPGRAAGGVVGDGLGELEAVDGEGGLGARRAALRRGRDLVGVARVEVAGVGFRDGEEVVDHGVREGPRAEGREGAAELVVEDDLVVVAGVVPRAVDGLLAARGVVAVGVVGVGVGERREGLERLEDGRVVSEPARGGFFLS